MFARCTHFTQESLLGDTQVFFQQSLVTSAIQSGQQDALNISCQPVRSSLPEPPLVSAATAPLSTVRGDFNGDGQTDSFWRNNSTGEVGVWLKSSDTTASVPITVVDANWQVQLVNDFNGDRKSDLLWRHNRTQEIAVWLMDGASFSSAKVVSTVNVNWKVEGTGDFNGDRRADVVWRNSTTGEVALWLMNGTVFTPSTIATVPGSNLEIEAIADFNRDTRPDILWRNYLSGDNLVWLMAGTTVASTQVLRSEPNLNWRVEGASDSNGDGRVDIFWRNAATGQGRVWLLDDLTFKQETTPAAGSGSALPITPSSPTSSGLATISNLSFSGLEGDAGTFQIRLNQAPTTDVTLTFSGGSFVVVDADGDIRNGSQNSITLTRQNWSQPLTVWFMAEADGASANRVWGNTVTYSLSGGLVGSGTYDLGNVTNTYAPDPVRFNIDLDFRSDYLGFWTPARRAVAQRAANDWARAIANEWSDFQLDSTIGRLETEYGRPNSFTTKRYVDDVVIFVNHYQSSGGIEGGFGGPDYEFGGWITSPQLMPRVGQIALVASAFLDQPDLVLYQAVLHEIGHALGLLGLNWIGYSQLDFATPQTATFRGEYSRAANGGRYVPLQSQDGPSPVTGVYDYWHPAARVPSIMSYGWLYQLSAPSNVDYAMLADSGYRVYGINA